MTIMCYREQIYHKKKTMKYKKKITKAFEYPRHEFQ